MSVTFAKYTDIQATIISIINANPAGAFSSLIATDNSSDKRYADDYIRAARRMAAARVLDAIGSNPKHPYWGYLATKVVVVHNALIPPSFGEIGVPEIQPVNSMSWGYIQGLEASADEIESYRGDSSGSTTLRLFTNPLGETSYTSVQNTASGVRNPISARYSTTNGYLKFTGFACQIPMIQVPDDGGRTLAGTVALAAASPNIIGSVAFQVGDIGDRLIIVYDNTVVFTGIILSLSTTSIANDTAVTDTNAEVTLSGASARTEDVTLAVNDILDNKIPLELAATVVRLAIGLLVKEGDSLQRLASLYVGQGEVDLIKIVQGATSVNALDVTRAIQSFQKYKQ